ncbi:diguanylate cyclase [Geodermatophilus sp. DF01_2]|uniref:diguanylate cyclase domain-containing protein n=1 Tax=Geodermatophilus sp. DF01-2 TaxID=2559610 RepID=UPI0014315AE2|nr:diguanylate cyclase [Geodermatophilus sp. DF01_2]
MPPAPNPFGVSLPVSALLPPEDDVTCLLPGPNSVSAHLAERLAAVPDVPASLIVLGLLRGDGAGPIHVSALAAATAVVARSLRGDDWLGRSGSDEFAVLLGSSAPSAEVAATRLTTAISELGIPGLGACAGVVALEAGITAAETMHRATGFLQTARSLGRGAVVRHAG